MKKKSDSINLSTFADNGFYNKHRKSKLSKKIIKSPFNAGDIKEKLLT